ncbi:hypothetical protein OPV22_030392 [Ensete ventricosum]|uniref:Uncharacterized protein n=1 Tax=Ensete ventricosum TaxID=4639 RepID=A0AAV8QFU0_ENSVE|nr:hypothetical protein OPV22_030392 [Ensete ventricosum]
MRISLQGQAMRAQLLDSGNGIRLNIPINKNTPFRYKKTVSVTNSFKSSPETGQDTRNQQQQHREEAAETDDVGISFRRLLGDLWVISIPKQHSTASAEQGINSPISSAMFHVLGLLAVELSRKRAAAMLHLFARNRQNAVDHLASFLAGGI